MKWILAALIVLVYCYLLVAPLLRRKAIPKELQKKKDLDGECNLRIRILKDAEESFAEYLRLIDHARTSIHIVASTFEDNNVGNVMLAALYTAATKGIHVRILLDAKHIRLSRSGKQYIQCLLSMPNVTICDYARFHIWAPWRLFDCLHMDFLVADGQIAVLEQHALLVQMDEQGNPAETGTVSQLEDCFEALMAHHKTAKHHICALANRAKTEHAKAHLDRLYQHVGRHNVSWFATEDYAEITEPVAAAAVLYNPALFYQVTEWMRQSEEQARIQTADIKLDLYMTNRLMQLCNYGKGAILQINAPLQERMIEKIKRTGATIEEAPDDDYGMEKGSTFSIGNTIFGLGSMSWEKRCAYVNSEIYLIYKMSASISMPNGTSGLTDSP